MTIVLASNNKHKIVELESFMKKMVPDVEIKSLKEINFFDEIEENGTTFEENSFIKANTIAKLGYIAIADDSGLMVDALNGEPGVYSARYAGEPSNDKNNNEKLLNALKEVPTEKRTAKFVSVITCVFPDGKVVSARGECPGTILYDYRGNGGFGYDPLFLYEPLNKTFAELTAEEKNSVSHRARAIEAFSGKFAEEINK